MTLPASKLPCSKHLSHHEMRPGSNPTWDNHDKTFQIHEDVDDEIIHKSLHVQRPEVLNKPKECMALVCTLDSACPKEKQGLWPDYTITCLTPHMKCRSSSSLGGFGFSGFMRSLETLAGVCLFPFQPPAAFCMLKQAKSTKKFSAKCFLYNRNAYCSIKLV